MSKSHSRKALPYSLCWLSVVLATTASASQLELEAVEVVGTNQNEGLYSGYSGTALKSSTPIRETAQNVQVVGPQMLEDISAMRLDDTLDYVSGLARQNGFGGLWDNFSIRGFSGDVNTGPEFLRNGFAANRGFNARRDTANVERIEFLKGPASALYGRGDPGGTLNIVTKRPQWSQAGKARLSYGSDDFKRGELDLTGPLHEDLAYRLNLAWEDADSFRDKVDSRREFIAPALTWRASEQTLFMYDGEYLRHRTPMDRGVVAVDNKLGVIPVSRFLGEPNDGPVTLRNATHQLLMEHHFNADWQARLGGGYKEGTLKGFSTEPSALVDGQTLRRQRRYRDYESSDYSLQAELLGIVETGAVVHNLLLGADSYRFEIEQLMLRVNPTADNPYAIDIFDPVYGQPQPDPLPNTHSFERQKVHAFYLQNQMELGQQWRVLAGTRFDSYRQSMLNKRNGQTRQQSHSVSSPRLGLVYLANDWLSLYTNASRSFRPNSGSDVNGGAFLPERGRSFDLGMKMESVDGRLGGSMALFQTDKENVVTSDPSNPGFSIAAGEVRSRGVELDFSGQLTQGLRLSASYAYVDAEVVKDNTLRKGARLLNVPKHAASLLVVQEVGRAGIGFGINHVGRRSGDTEDSGFELPAYTLGKLMGYYQLSQDVRLSLDINNLTDRDHYVSSYFANWVTPGPRRNVVGSVEYRF